MIPSIPFHRRVFALVGVCLIAISIALASTSDDEQKPASSANTTTDSKEAGPEGVSTEKSAADSQNTPSLGQAVQHKKPEIPSNTNLVPYDRSSFRSDPVYPEKYNAEEQILVYGGKYVNPTERPMLELGRELYTEGPFQKAPSLIGDKNLLFNHLLLYGDWRNAIAYNDNGALEQGAMATRLNLDVDFKLTATERIHAFFRPLDRNGEFTRLDFSGSNHDSALKLDADVDALFFEGDMGRIAEGFTDKENKVDMPIAFGLMPLLFQNGVWVEDAFTGIAWTVPARNSPMLDISNADITFFAGFDEVTSGAVKDAAGKLVENNAHIYGVTSFIEANEGYWEVGYGFTDTDDNLNNQGYHNVTAAFTRRYGGILSNTLRVVYNFGQDFGANQTKTADGVIFLIENSLITSDPSALVPYLNAFVGVDRAQSLARDAGAGGILKNTGINFETDGLTGFPKMDDTGQGAYGGALGVEYLFDLDQQIVFETAMVQPIGDANEIGRPAKGEQFGIGIRYQIPISHSWILRADTIAASRDNDEDLAGIRLEFRHKF